MSKKKKKTVYSKKKICILIVIVLILSTCIYPLFRSSTIFKIEKRLHQIKLEQKKDDKDFKTVGWIRVQGTKIDVPIIAIVNGDEFPVTREKYAWTVNNDDKIYNSMMIYGHNVYNLSAKPKISSKNFKRFEEVLAFIYYDFAKENQYIQLSMNNKEYIYKIFSVAIVNSYNVSHLPVGEYSPDELKYEIKVLKENSLFDYNMKVTEKDKVLSLVTCTRIYGMDSNDNIVVTAKRIDEKSVKKTTKIKKTKKYNELVKVLKGESADEGVDA